MTKFSFANLLGGGQRSRAATEDDEQDKAEETEEESETENEEDQAEGEDGDDAAESDQDEARRAILAERGRIATILSSATPETRTGRNATRSVISSYRTARRAR